MELMMSHYLLKRISKTNEFSKIYDMVKDEDYGHSILDDIDSKDAMILAKIGLGILTALTDKGFKSLASILVQEYFNDEDLNDDGKIYGKDFVFKNPPPVLKQVPKAKTAKVVDWEEWKKENS